MHMHPLHCWHMCTPGALICMPSLFTVCASCMWCCSVTPCFVHGKCFFHAPLAVDELFKALCDCAALNPDSDGEGKLGAELSCLLPSACMYAWVRVGKSLAPRNYVDAYGVSQLIALHALNTNQCCVKLPRPARPMPPSGAFFQSTQTSHALSPA